MNVSMKVIITDFFTLNCYKHPVSNVDLSDNSGVQFTEDLKTILRLS